MPAPRASRSARPPLGLPPGRAALLAAARDIDARWLRHPAAASALRRTTTAIFVGRPGFDGVLRDLELHFHGRRELGEAAVLALATQGNLVAVGPPGTGKTALVSRLTGRVAAADPGPAGLAEAGSSAGATPLARPAFLLPLSPFTEIAELWGPVSLAALMRAVPRFERAKDGSARDARVVFLDEIGQASRAILAALHGLVNERVYAERGQRERLPLLAVFATANPSRMGTLELGPGDPLMDRFFLRVVVDNTCAPSPGSPWRAEKLPASGRGARERCARDLASLLCGGFLAEMTALGRRLEAGRGAPLVQLDERAFEPFLGMETLHASIAQARFVEALSDPGSRFVRQLAQAVLRASDQGIVLSDRRLVRLAKAMCCLQVLLDEQRAVLRAAGESASPLRVLNHPLQVLRLAWYRESELGAMQAIAASLLDAPGGRGALFESRSSPSRVSTAAGGR